jgi:rubrerythrin
MKGEKGTCASDKSKIAIYRTKFDTEQHAKDALNMHIKLQVTNPNNIVYECKVCGMWHFGKQDLKDKFGMCHSL